MKRAILLAASLAFSVTASAQLDVGRLIDFGRKAVDAGGKLKDANREFSQEDEIQLGDGIAATLLGASPHTKDANQQRYVNRVGRRVALHSDRPDLPWNGALLLIACIILLIWIALPGLRPSREAAVLV